MMTQKIQKLIGFLRTWWQEILLVLLLILIIIIGLVWQGALIYTVIHIIFGGPRK